MKAKPIYNRLLKSTPLIMSSLIGISGPGYAGETDDYLFKAKGYSGSRDRHYQVYIPDSVSAPAPLIMVLHGCVQDGSDAMDDWGFQAAADANGFILVTPSITSYDGMRSQNCWGFWFEQHTHQGAGEPEDLHQIALEVESNYPVDPDRRYITGFSSGGAMVEIAAITHNEYWAAAAPAAGLAYGETSSSVSLAGCWGAPSFKSVNTSLNSIRSELDDDYVIPTLVLQNDEDCVVQQPAGRNIRDTHLQLFGGVKAGEQSCEFYHQNNYGCRHTYYTENGAMGDRSIVETIFFDGPLNTPSSGDNDYGHYWVAGQNGVIDSYNVKVGPDYPALIWDFFSRHPRSGGGGANGKPSISLNGENPMQVDLGGVFSDPGATAMDAEDGGLPVSADCQVNTGAEGEYYCTYSATDSDSNLATRSRTVNVVDPRAPEATCGSASASPSAHIDAGRAVKGGLYDLYALSKTDQERIGSSFDSWSQVTLFEGAPGEWFSAEPAACRDEKSPGETECSASYDSNWNHIQAGRAYNDMGYAKTVGGGDSLGLANIYVYTWVKETDTDYFEVGECP